MVFLEYLPADGNHLRTGGASFRSLAPSHRSSGSNGSRWNTNIPRPAKFQVYACRAERDYEDVGAGVSPILFFG
jgi:hypothetical protein